MRDLIDLRAGANNLTASQGVQRLINGHGLIVCLIDSDVIRRCAHCLARREEEPLIRREGIGRASSRGRVDAVGFLLERNCGIWRFLCKCESILFYYCYFLFQILFYFIFLGGWGVGWAFRGGKDIKTFKSSK